MKPNNGNLKILHLTSVFEVGGQQRLISDLVRYDAPFNDHYLAILRRSTEALAFFKKEIKVLFYEGLSDDEIVGKLKNFITENEIDILFAHNRHTWDVAADVVKDVSGVIIYLIAHSLDGKRHSESDAERESKIKSNIVVTEKMISTSDFVKNEYLKLMPIEKGKIIRIHNGVEVLTHQTSSSRESMRNSLGLKNDYLLLGMVARLAKIKNQEFIIESIAGIKEGERNFKLVIVGDGPERAHLLSRISELGLKDYVILKENSFSINDYYEASDIFINCSLFESCSLSILEAMSHALPVIASDVGGNREIVVNNETGFLFPINDKKTFIESLKKLLNNAELRNQMGKKGRDRVIKEFNIQDTVRNYQKLFNSYEGQVEDEAQRVGRELL